MDRWKCPRCGDIEEADELIMSAREIAYKD